MHRIETDGPTFFILLYLKFFSRDITLSYITIKVSPHYFPFVCKLRFYQLFLSLFALSQEKLFQKFPLRRGANGDFNVWRLYFQPSTNGIQFTDEISISVFFYISEKITEGYGYLFFH